MQAHSAMAGLSAARNLSPWVYQHRISGQAASLSEAVPTPWLTIRCEYPDTDLPPTEVTFRLSPSYGLTTGHEANEWFIDMMYEHEEFVVETDEPGEPPLSFWTETVRGVMVE